MKKVIVAILLMFTVVSAISQSALKVNSIEFKASYFKYKGTILDVRTALEYAEGHIENAKNIDVSSSLFESEVEKLDKDQPIFVYCAIGVRSSKASSILRKKGFKHVFDLDGGYQDLLKVGMKNAK
jgi:rhodanese-related sulfurtransferase